MFGLSTMGHFYTKSGRSTDRWVKKLGSDIIENNRDYFFNYYYAIIAFRWCRSNLGDWLESIHLGEYSSFFVYGACRKSDLCSLSNCDY